MIFLVYWKGGIAFITDGVFELGYTVYTMKVFQLLCKQCTVCSLRMERTLIGHACYLLSLDSYM